MVKVFAIDFDGTCVTDDFPLVGKDIGAAPVLRELVANGHKLVLHTLRADIDESRDIPGCVRCAPGKYLQDAVDWFEREGIPLFGVNSRPDVPCPSPKLMSDISIDDRNAGTPLIQLKGGDGHRPYVDWRAMRSHLAAMGFIAPGGR